MIDITVMSYEDTTRGEVQERIREVSVNDRAVIIESK
jgi:hypothetical protein